ncbi:hypothetical protein DNTS_028207 [Danionella cerebrum]|uniref:RNA helicase n=1 Tax=Danionella cerebrum TaxID=2873325 RepID=A0A553QBH4_9TELE|nr:hypothetical protein DNTS_028207 [Danionella translucida]
MPMGGNNGNGKFSLNYLRLVGFDFITFLQSEKISITNRETLKDIYNYEFRERDGVRGPNFSSVLFALKNSSRTLVTGTDVYFDKNLRERKDQWSRSFNRQQKISNAISLPSNNGLPPRAGPEDGAKPRRTVAQMVQKNNVLSILEVKGVQLHSEKPIKNSKIHWDVKGAGVHELKLIVENICQHAVIFKHWRALRYMKNFILEDSKGVANKKPLLLQSGQKYEVILKFHSDKTACYPAVLVFEFKKNNAHSRRFHIQLSIEATWTSELAQQLTEPEPYRPPRRVNIKFEDFKILEGNRPIKSEKSDLEHPVPLDNYPCPPYLSKLVDALKAGQTAETSAKFLQGHLTVLEEKLSFHNYTKRFGLLLHLEEAQMLVDIKKYNKDDVSLLPGVSESRPSVLRGDFLFLTKSEEVQHSSGTKYKGYVHRVELDRIKLSVHKNRLLLKLQHRAVQFAVQHNLKDVLFPEAPRNQNHMPPALRLFDQKLEKNPEQKTAVHNIVAGTSKPAPYLVYGPPGTGKTVTIVEAIKQLERKQAYILACAPTNSAADQLGEKLIESQHVDAQKIYRLYAVSFNPNEIPKNLEKHSNVEGGEIFFPCKKDLMSYKILICTLFTAGRLVTAGFPVGHFSYVFVDEAGHAKEPECIIAIAELLNPKTGQLVLTGDPKQLGPILSSPFAIKYGLDLSLLERLVTHNKLYQKGKEGYNNRYITKLLENYRSHPSILKVSNDMFYDGELKASYNVDFPVIFEGVLGKHSKEQNSPSIFNAAEIEVIISYLKKLLLIRPNKGTGKLSPKDIGIIAPYRKQVEKTRKAIKIDRDLKSLMGIEELKVGSVEEFQGQERKVIIVSTVRGGILDESFNIGFLKNEKRFNVAITRAKALLIVVGNPIILQTDETWRRFMEYCDQGGGCIGYDWKTDVLGDRIHEEDTGALSRNIMRRRTRNSGLSMAAVRAIGLDFIEMLGESNRRSITDRNTLKTIYDEEFRDREAKDPNFSRVIYALRNGNKARVSRTGHVYFNSNVRVRLHDQWFRPCKPRNPTVPAPGHESSASLVNNQETFCTSTDSGVRARRSLTKEILQRLKTTDRSHFIADKCGVKLSSDLHVENGKVCICVDQAEVQELKFFVENTGQEAVFFTHYTALSWLQNFTFEDSKAVTPNNPLCLNSRERYEVTVRFKSDQDGAYTAIVAFEFKQNLNPGTQHFHIVRFIEAVCRSKLDAELAPVEPYKPLRLSLSEPGNFKVDEGVRPDDLAQIFLANEVPLGQYNPPAEMPLSKLAKLQNDECSSLMFGGKFQKLQSLLETPVDFQNYTERFGLLLHLEECQMHVDIKKYNKDNITLTRDSTDKRLLILNLPGVSENRPSVLRGDHLLLTKSEEVKCSNFTKYKGFVHKVELDQVKLGFSKRFLQDVYIDGMKFHVEFTVNRLPLRLQHRAVHMAVQHNLEDVLFPDASRSLSHLEENTEQCIAVRNIVAGTSKPAPYLLFGPPGTGKTVTIVEAIKQVQTNLPNACILACAPSNSAADQLCEKLITSQHVDARKIYRIYASSRNPIDIPESLKKCSNLEGEIFIYPRKEDLMSYKIVVCTLVTAGRLVSGGFSVDHFSHIFVDEAGHAVEPELIISVAGLLNAQTGQLVLAGDSKQLGPILRSPLAIKYGLGISFLERLMTQNDLYRKDDGEFDQRYVPNELFYDGELQACADIIVSNQYCMWEHLPKKGFPVIFHGVPGKDEREANSPSFFNVFEINIIVDYLKKLLLTQGKKGISRISPKEIGIIAPYRKQVEKIRRAIKTTDGLHNHMNIGELKVGSVEEFQGQERKVIMVSAVRSSAQHLVLDETFNIGFLKNEKRFNVAVTRAKSLLIIVGNPNILRTDESWGRFIDFCHDQGGYTGIPIISVERIEEVEKCLLALNLKDEDTGESPMQRYVDPEFRHDY